MQSLIQYQILPHRRTYSQYCDDNDVDVHTYYYWMKKLREKSLCYSGKDGSPAYPLDKVVQALTGSSITINPKARKTYLYDIGIILI